MSNQALKDDLSMDDTDLLTDDSELSTNQFLTFAIGDETYGIEILRVVEIIRFLKITEIPHSIDYVKGIINLRGKIIPVVDVRTRFAFEEKEIDERTCIIVAKVADLEVGLIVDTVSEVTYVEDENIDKVDSLANSLKENFVKSIGKTKDGVIIIVDLDQLFQEKYTELQQIA